MSKTTRAQVSIITDPEMLGRLQGLSDHITLFLCRKAMMEYRRQDLQNPTLLSNVKFWFQIDPNDGTTMLCYDKHPTEWNIDAILKDITDMEHLFYAQEGVVFWDSR
jgi:hypothetical protein